MKKTTLTCLAAAAVFWGPAHAATRPDVAVGGSDTRTYVIDLRAPASGAAIGQFTWTAATAGDNNLANNSATLATTFANFAPNAGLDFNTLPTFTYWVALGKKSVLESPMTRPSGTWAVDANGEGVGGMQSSPVHWKRCASVTDARY